MSVAGRSSRWNVRDRSREGVCRRAAFTLIELLVVIAIILLLVGIVLPALSKARSQGKATVCGSRLRTLGQGIAIYANEYDDYLPPSRMPNIDDQNWRIYIEGGIKYRPTFLAIMGSEVGIQPFDDPKPYKNDVDREGEAGGRQNYSSEVYVCPEAANWTDERNGAYGYNYQFLGNSRLLDSSDLSSYKNWPVALSGIKSPVRTVAVGDSMGTAAAAQAAFRLGYSNNQRDINALGNEGFNLDPPWLDPVNGEVADDGTWSEDGGGSPAGVRPGPRDGEGQPARSAPHERHRDRANILWLDGHGSAETLESLGYVVEEHDVVGLEGNNRFFSTDQRDVVWLRTGLGTSELKGVDP